MGSPTTSRCSSPGNILQTVSAKPWLLDELDVSVRRGTLRSAVQTGRNEQAEVVFQRLVAPHGWSGSWHTQSGVVFVTVAEGVLTYYHDYDPCQGKTFPKVTPLPRKPMATILRVVFGRRRAQILAVLTCARPILGY